jgi:hypothetical protein
MTDEQLALTLGVVVFAGGAVGSSCRGFCTRSSRAAVRAI